MQTITILEDPSEWLEKHCIPLDPKEISITDTHYPAVYGTRSQNGVLGVLNSQRDIDTIRSHFEIYDKPGVKWYHVDRKVADAWPPVDSY